MIEAGRSNDTASEHHECRGFMMPTEESSTPHCQFCGRPNPLPANYVKRLKYCSIKCYHDAQRAASAAKLHPCAYCTKPTLKKFCSHECSCLIRRGKETAERACAACGVTFTALATLVRHGGGKYCSRECYFSIDKARPLADRFWEKVSVGENCWLWTGNVNSKGYGVIWIDQAERAYAHRVSWELHHGPIPDGMLVLHHCDNPPCVNATKCLFLGTPADNTADMMSKGRYRSGPNAPSCGKRRSCHSNA